MDREFRTLLESYLPDWRYDRTQPEGALLYTAWQLLEETRHRMEQLPQKHQREFLNAWPLPARASEPMRTYAVLEAPTGTYVPAGTEMYLSGSGTRLWKTLEPACAESMKLVRQVLESEKLGKTLELPLPSKEEPLRLLDADSPGQQKNMVRFFHAHAFRSQKGCRVDLHFPKSDPALLPILEDPKRTRWTLEPGSIPISNPTAQEESLQFQLPGAEAEALLAEFLPGYPLPPWNPGPVELSSFRKKEPYAVAVTDEETWTEGTLEPFGLRPEPWRACYLSCPDALSLAGGEMELEFTLTSEQREETLPIPEQKPKYRNVMFRMPPPPPPIPELRADVVVWEYWNGHSWLPLADTRNQAALFAGSDARRVHLKSRWPEDAQPCEVQGQEQYWLRWRVVRAQGMGLLPCRVYVPKVHDLCMSGRLYRASAEVSVRRGLDPVYKPLDPKEALFPKGLSENTLWLCFDRPPLENSLCLYVELAEKQAGREISLWESTEAGWSPLKCRDETDGMGHSGPMLLTGIRGKKTCQFEQMGWWICLCIPDTESRMESPKLLGLYPGAVCLEAVESDRCLTDETVQPLHGGAVLGRTLMDSFGGLPEESDDQLLARTERYRHHLGRGVSPLDVEQLVQNTYGDVVRTRSRRKEDLLEVAVLMQDIHQHSAAFLQRKEEITQLLERDSLIPTLGISLRVREPNFYPIRVTVWMHRSRDFENEQAEVRRILREFLNPVTGKFRGDGWRIGDLPTEQELCNHLVTQLPQISLVKVLLTARTPDGQETECTGIRDVFALPVAGTVVVHGVRGEEIS